MFALQRGEIQVHELYFYELWRAAIILGAIHKKSQKRNKGTELMLIRLQLQEKALPPFQLMCLGRDLQNLPPQKPSSR
jgi:hypothetical protein